MFPDVVFHAPAPWSLARDILCSLPTIVVIVLVAAVIMHISWFRINECSAFSTDLIIRHLQHRSSTCLLTTITTKTPRAMTHISATLTSFATASSSSASVELLNRPLATVPAARPCPPLLAVVETVTGPANALEARKPMASDRTAMPVAAAPFVAPRRTGHSTMQDSSIKSRPATSEEPPIMAPSTSFYSPPATPHQVLNTRPVVGLPFLTQQSSPSPRF